MDESNQHRSSSDDDQPPPRYCVDVIDAESSLPGADVAWIRAMGAQAVEILARPIEGVVHDVRVRLVGDDEMSEAHQRYSGIAGTTDVLTFDLSGDGRTLDVDIMVCVDEARRQAGQRGHDVRREALLYLVHGVLHCLGHDDHDDASFERMHAAEDEVLERIGVGATFNADLAHGDNG